MTVKTKQPVSEADGSGRGSAIFRVSEGVTGMRHIFVNLFFVEDLAADDGSWVLVDAGLVGHTARIRGFADGHFGRPPKAILLTHGHFDHVGALEELAREWNVPVYAHPLEAPYLTGKAHYPPPDPTVGGGAMARLSFLFPTNPVDVGTHLQPLPPDGNVPGLQGWHWLHTPGHAPGHVSFFREADRTLLAGDAFIATNQASAFSVLTQREEIMGPPTYFTIDWKAARKSVEKLAALEPEFAGTGHGKPLRGSYLKKGLQLLDKYFAEIALPQDGRYVRQPVISNEQGTVRLPPPVPNKLMRTVATVSVTALVGAGIGYALIQRKKKLKQKRQAEGGHGKHYDYP